VDSRQSQMLLLPARAGRVTRVFVHEGQSVSPGAPLVQLDDHLVKLQEEEAALGVQAAQLQLSKARDGLRQYQAKVAQVQAALEAAKNKVVEAESALARKDDLVKRELLNHFEQDVSRAQLNEAKALEKAEQNRFLELKAINPNLEVKLAELQLTRNQTELERAHRDREEYLLRAPVKGLVLRLQVQEGDLLAPSSPSPAIWLSPEGPYIVRAEVSQEFAGRVKEGLAAHVEDEASDYLLAKGKVTEVSGYFLPRRQFSALPTSTNTGLTLDCLIDLQEVDARLRLGQRVRVRILENQTSGGHEKGS